ncbi:MAG: NAD(P)-dependent dehydrogenase (short-subunit alcohol dehydrogenase family) [Hyphomicrobiaceae bacterium]|jgi:NAD(P)-dependent dehydrogenase (short-subunit alcohol dehydrogenase family)
MTTWRKAGNTAVITGGASGIGLAAAERFVRDGMNVVIADKNADALAQASASLQSAAEGRSKVVAQLCDVSEMADVEALRDVAFEMFGGVHCLMNNAGAGLRVGAPWENLAELQRTLEINLWGVIHGCHAFIPAMLESGVAGVVINTGSKQGITRPPGNYAYNLSKVGVIAYSESVAHALAGLEDCKLSAHLLVPGFVYTAMVSQHIQQKPPSAWTAEQVIEFMHPCLDRGDFYILCPDNDVTRAIDEKRIQWNTDDLIKNRPPLSRWHADYADAFAAYMKS